MHGGSFEKASAPPLFLEDENFFQKSARVVLGVIAVELEPREPIFENVLIFEKKGGC